MLDHFTYTDLSLTGLFEAYCTHYNIEIKDNSITLPKKYGDVHLKRLLLPGDIGVVFGNFNFEMDILTTHVKEIESKYALWISISEGDSQEFTWADEKMIIDDKKQAKAFLFSSLFQYEHFRRKGTKGKSLVIFIPNYLIETLSKEKSKELLLGKFYALKCKGLSLVKLGEDEIDKVFDFFEQWEKHQNYVGLAKYAFQLLEWYFVKLISFINEEDKYQKLSNEEAQDLFALHNLLHKSISVAKPDLDSFQLTVTTSITRLKKLFQTIYDKTIFEYFTHEKIKKASEVLLSSEKNIAEIAYEFGYANPSNFSEAFKKQYNLTPNEFRQKEKNSN
jgi:AraC-like DNA-binding protein